MLRNVNKMRTDFSEETKEKGQDLGQKKEINKDNMCSIFQQLIKITQ